MTLEEKAAETILQSARKIKIGNKEYSAAPPSTATLILVSEAVSQLPQIKLNEDNIVSESLWIAKDCRKLGDIAAILILGARNIKETVTTQETREKRCLWGLIRYNQKVKVTKEVDKVAELSKLLLEEYSPSQLHSMIATLLHSLDLADFFALTTFLIEVNLLRPTKVETATIACGQ